MGLHQVEDLAHFIETDTADETILAILRADPGAPSSKFVSSNLRRAISTLAGGFRDRLQRRPHDKIVVLPSLQEIR